MRIPKKRRYALYKAISDKVMDLRVAILRGDVSLRSEEIDDALFNLVLAQWEGAKKALGIEREG